MAKPWEKYPEVKAWEKYPKAEPKKPSYTTPHNLLAGAVNPFINIANLVPRGTSALAHLAGAPSSVKIPEIPEVSHSPNSPAYLAGDIGSSIATFIGSGGILGGGAKLATKIPKIVELGEFLAEHPKLPLNLAKRGVQVAKSAGAGALSSYGTAGGSNKNRMGSALGGALGGALGEGLGQMLSGSTGSVSHMGDYDKLSSLYKNKHPFDLEGNAASNMLGDIGEEYVKARNKAIPLYNKTFNGLTGKIKMKPDDLKEFNKYIGSLEPSEKRLILSKNVKPHDLYDKSGDADAQQIHFMKSRLKGLSNKMYQSGAMGHPLGSLYEGASDSLSNDLDSFLKGNNKLDAYNDAAKSFAKNVVPFHENSVFSKSIKPTIEAHTENVGGEDILNYNGINKLARTSKIVSKLLPNSTEKDFGSINQLEKLLGGDKDKTVFHIRNNLASPFIKRDNMGNNHLDIEKFLAREEKLSPEQRDYLFSKEEQKPFHALRKSKPTQSDKTRRRATEAVLGGAVGHLLFPKIGGYLGVAGGLSVGEVLRKGISSIFSPNEVESLASHILKTNPIKQHIGFSSPASSLGGNVFNLKK